MKNGKLSVLFLILCLLVPIDSANAQYFDFTANAPDGPYAMTINVFLDSSTPAKKFRIKKALELAGKTFKENLNLEVTWRFAGKISELKKWYPASENRLVKIMNKKSKSDLNVIFTNKRWIEQADSGYYTYYGFRYLDSQTMIVYQSNINAKLKFPVLQCDLNTLVIQHEFGHLLGLGHNDNNASIMYQDSKYTLGHWFPEEIRAVKRELCVRGYLKIKSSPTTR